MKKIICVLLIASLFFSISNVYASTEEITNEKIEPLEQKQTVTTKAKVVETKEVYDRTVENIVDKVQEVTIEVIDGDYQGQKFNATYILSYDMDNKIMAYELDKGNIIFVQLTINNGEVEEVVVQDVVRQNYIIWMIALFFISVLVIGKKQGLKAIIGLIFTILAVFLIMINSIYQGHSPIFVSVGTSALIIVVTFIIISGFNKKSFTAALGTTGGVVLSGIIAFIFGMLAKLSGGQEEAVMLSMNSGNIIFNFRELLFAGIVIASLGACMDVGMSIASALDELKQHKPTMTGKELFKSGMNIGGDVIGTMTNTLILAYVGGALNLILLFMACDMSITDIINKETIASDLISAISGSMGVIYTIPITAGIYALFNRNKTAYKTKPDTLLEGQRSLKL